MDKISSSLRELLISYIASGYTTLQKMDMQNFDYFNTLLIKRRAMILQFSYLDQEAQKIGVDILEEIDSKNFFKELETIDQLLIEKIAKLRNDLWQDLQKTKTSKKLSMYLSSSSMQAQWMQKC